jgi:hypothetical protein
VLFPLRLDLELARAALEPALPGVREVSEIEFEYTGPDGDGDGATVWLGEPAGGQRGQNRTSIDAAVWWTDGDRRLLTFIEWKYTERNYGTCGGYASRGNKQKHLCENLDVLGGALSSACYLAHGRNTRRYAAGAFGQAPRLRASAKPVVLALAIAPTGDLVPGRTLPFRPLVEVAEVDPAGLAVRLDGAFPDVRPDGWAGTPNEPITLDAFMARYCEKRSGELRRFRRLAPLGAARNGKVALPLEAGPYRSGQARKYFVHDLLAAWQGFLDERIDLPPLLPQYQQGLRTDGQRHP